jgi:hypothetical protein
MNILKINNDSLKMNELFEFYCNGIRLGDILDCVLELLEEEYVWL